MEAGSAGLINALSQAREPFGVSARDRDMKKRAATKNVSWSGVEPIQQISEEREALDVIRDCVFRDSADKESGTLHE